MISATSKKYDFDATFKSKTVESDSIKMCLFTTFFFLPVRPLGDRVQFSAAGSRYRESSH